MCALRWAEGEEENKFSSRTPACNWLSEFAFLTIYVCIVRGMRGWCSFHGDPRDLFGTQAAPSKKMVFLSWRSTPTMEYTQFTNCAVHAGFCFLPHNSVRKIYFFSIQGFLGQASSLSHQPPSAVSVDRCEGWISLRPRHAWARPIRTL